MTTEWTLDQEQRIDYSPANESATLAVIKALQNIVGGNPREWPPLKEAIPSDALNALVAEGDGVTVTFSYNGLQITVHDDGQIVIRDPD